MAERSKQLEKVVTEAGRFTLSQGSNLIGSEHIVYGMLSVPDCAACAILNDCNVTALKYNAWWLPTAVVLVAEYVDWALGKLFPQRDFPLWRKLRLKLLIAYAAFTILFVIARNIWRF